MNAVGPMWRAVPGWVGLYEASTEGEIRSLERTVGGRHIKGRVLKHGRAHGGYHTVVLARDGQRFAFTVHRLVAETFLGPKPQGWHTCHENGDKGDNRPTNLRYDTPSANELDKVRQGRNPKALVTECPQGHEYTEANTMRDKHSHRSCRACHNERNRRNRQRARRADLARAA